MLVCTCFMGFLKTKVTFTYTAHGVDICGPCVGLAFDRDAWVLVAGYEHSCLNITLNECGEGGIDVSVVKVYAYGKPQGQIFLWTI